MLHHLEIKKTSSKYQYRHKTFFFYKKITSNMSMSNNYTFFQRKHKILLKAKLTFYFNFIFCVRQDIVSNKIEPKIHIIKIIIRVQVINFIRLM